MNRLKKITTPHCFLLLPFVLQQNPKAKICGRCNYVNETGYAFCTNCGFPYNNLLANEYHQRLRNRHQILFKAEYAVGVARIVLYIMASVLLLGIFTLFTNSNTKYVVALVAIILSALFFFLAFWSRSNPFSAMLTSFIILITFSAVNVFSKMNESFITSQGLISLMLCAGLLFVVMRGVTGAYRANLMHQELRVDV